MQTKNAVSNVYFIPKLCVLFGTETVDMYIVLYFQCVHRGYAIVP